MHGILGANTVIPMIKNTYFMLMRTKEQHFREGTLGTPSFLRRSHLTEDLKEIRVSHVDVWEKSLRHLSPLLSALNVFYRILKLRS